MKATRDAEWPSADHQVPPRVEMPAEPSRPEKKGMARGQRLRIQFRDGHSWDAIFWGGEGTETMVLHRTHGDWALMHLDLSRFSADQIVTADMMTEREIWEMQEIIKRTYT